ncbi:3-methyl-2-oxobutanoate dehydrogenase subunit VorB [Pelolinea submarina]|uniref:2-oxoglutarate ferredoxin oxidoreductase subunit alpha n=1 Tax=Pelolinea submarina TaxID=913107 RepID=A0A347ZNB2_9CHLR|nr:3-methyl-2-oxobutanoate dehydrogenase subunit VorB [Pelolinea submarina]REG08395.1 2-oxoglutarate ferredoxin oxidoreductase subunit alpha [Pelolinea submarina]BBB46793.1 2-oxoglutarate/2-oxoacid ferredoxin oxidoreductase subunit alpha [Pelolinea submarina]
MAKELWKGNEAFAEAAIRAGLQAYFGYPITPQTEALEYMSARMPELGRVFLQAESELGAINMVYGAAATGVRTMTSTSSPGTSLMMEGLSYIAATELPMVLVDVVRGGPGLGTISPSQGDYNQMVHGGGHGDYYPIVMAPAGVQETVDMVYGMFDIAEKYRSIGVVMLDGSIGQMIEPAEMPPMLEVRKDIPEWAVRGGAGKDKRILTSINLDPAEMEKMNLRLLKRWKEVEKNEVRFAEYYMDDAKIAIIGNGTAGRIALSAVRTARAAGIPVGLLRPISLRPFPVQAVQEVAAQLDNILVVEMNAGMMLEDILKIVQGKTSVEFYGRIGGVMPYPEEILAEIQRIAANPAPIKGHPRDLWMERIEPVINQ